MWAGAGNVAGFGKKNYAYKFSVTKHELEGLFRHEMNLHTTQNEDVE